jgi:hypothetical protein
MQLGAIAQRDTRRSAVGGDHVADRRVDHDLGAEALRGARQHLREAAVAALVEPPGPEVAVLLTDVVVQQHQARAL